MLSISRLAWIAVWFWRLWALWRGCLDPMSGCGASTWAPRAPPCSALRYGPVPGCSPGIRMQSFQPEWSIAERRAWAGLLFLTLVFVNFVRFMLTIADLDSPPVVDRGIAFAAFHVEPVRAADRLGRRGENPSRTRERTSWNSTNGTCACSARRIARAIGRLLSSSSHRPAAGVSARGAPGVVAVAADRRECADWPADRQIARRTRVPGGAIRAGTSMTEFAVRNDIRQWRLARAEMTQAELARLCGVTRQTIIALEAGKYSPSLELAFKLARALGRNLDEVFRYEEQK